MIEPRIYRAAFIPAVLALVLVAFSLQDRPGALPQELAADIIFDADVTAHAASRLARQVPDRRAGTRGDAAVAELVSSRLQEHGFETRLDRFSADGRNLTNVIGTRTGAVREQIVVIAGRDAGSIPDEAGSAADTAALLELARALEGRAGRRTIVLVSADGTWLDQAGIRRFIETAEDPSRIRAVLAISDLGAAAPSRPELVTWSDDATRGSLGLERTALAALRREIAGVPEGEGAFAQLAHLAMPIAPGAQGALLDAGLDAVRVSGSGELPPPSSAAGAADADRVGPLGRAVLQTVSAIDGATALEHGPESYLTLGRNLLPGWAIALFGLSLIVPALAVSIDAVARARRRREPISRPLQWIASLALPFVVGVILVRALGLAGLAPDPETSPLPEANPFDVRAGVLLAVVAITAAGAWLLCRRALRARDLIGTEAAAPGAACAAWLLLAVTVLLVWLVNPFTALALIPAAHLWLLATLPDAPMRTSTRALLVAGGMLAPALVAVYYVVELSLGPLEGAWYVFLLVSGGQLGFVGGLLACVVLGVLVAVVAIVAARARSPLATPERGEAAFRGPGGYAGPGSLGGPPSALPRQR